MKRILTGLQPTNNITLGNYLGSIKNFLEYQNNNELFIFVANLHSITTQSIPKIELENNSINLVKSLLACGVNPEKTCIFFQSEILEHTMLEHILMCHTTIGELNRMTQFKDKSLKVVKQNNGTEKIPTGLLIYPVLMSSDILLYSPDLVPVGNDQKQHLELTRNIAIRMNNMYNNNLFKIPEPGISKKCSRIMDLQNPSIKMSKSSSSHKGVIFLNDEINISLKKIKSAVTDNLNQVKYDVKNQPGISNLIEIYTGLTSLTINDVEQKYINKTYGEFKNDLIKILEKFLITYQARFTQYSNEYIYEITNKGKLVARKIAKQKLKQIFNTIGLM